MELELPRLARLHQRGQWESRRVLWRRLDWRTIPWTSSPPFRSAFRQVRAVLARDTGNENTRHGPYFASEAGAGVDLNREGAGSRRSLTNSSRTAHRLWESPSEWEPCSRLRAAGSPWTSLASRRPTARTEGRARSSSASSRPSSPARVRSSSTSSSSRRRPPSSTSSGSAAPSSISSERSGDVQEPRRLLRTRRRLPSALRRTAWTPILPAGRSLRGLGVDALFSPLATAAFHEPGLFHVAIAYDFQELAHRSSSMTQAAPAKTRSAPTCSGATASRRSHFTADTRCREASTAAREGARHRADHGAGRPQPQQEVREQLHALDSAFRARLLRVSTRTTASQEPRGALAVVVCNPPPADEPFRIVLCGAQYHGGETRSGSHRLAGPRGPHQSPPVCRRRRSDRPPAEARALVFPGVYEGFRIADRRAFQLGTPVACSRIPALEEVAGDAALFFDAEGADRVDAITRALECIWRDEELRVRLSARGTARALLRRRRDRPGVRGAFRRSASHLPGEGPKSAQIATRISAVEVIAGRGTPVGALGQTRQG